MEKVVLNMLKLFLINAKENNILEINENELRENFKKFKFSEKYGKYFYSYIYDENNYCMKFEKELNTLIKNKQISRYNEYLYIYNIDSSCKTHYSKELNRIVIQMVSDYIKLNMEKEKVKII